MAGAGGSGGRVGEVGKLLGVGWRWAAAAEGGPLLWFAIHHMCARHEPPAAPAPPCLYCHGCRTTHLLALLLFICVQRDEAQEPWDSYRNSFTLLMSKAGRWGGGRGCGVLQGGARQK